MQFVPDAASKAPRPSRSPHPNAAGDNELGLTFELLLYGTTGKYAPISRRLSRAAQSRAKRVKAARMLQVRSLPRWLH